MGCAAFHLISVLFQNLAEILQVLEIQIIIEIYSVIDSFDFLRRYGCKIDCTQYWGRKK